MFTKNSGCFVPMFASETSPVASSVETTVFLSACGVQTSVITLRRNRSWTVTVFRPGVGSSSAGDHVSSFTSTCERFCLSYSFGETSSRVSYVESSSYAGISMSSNRPDKQKQSSSGTSDSERSLTDAIFSDIDSVSELNDADLHCVVGGVSTNNQKTLIHQHQGTLGGQLGASAPVGSAPEPGAQGDALEHTAEQLQQEGHMNQAAHDFAQASEDFHQSGDHSDASNAMRSARHDFNIAAQNDAQDGHFHQAAGALNSLAAAETAEGHTGAAQQAELSAGSVLSNAASQLEASHPNQAAIAATVAAKEYAKAGDDLDAANAYETVAQDLSGTSAQLSGMAYTDAEHFFTKGGDIGDATAMKGGAEIEAKVLSLEASASINDQAAAAAHGLGNEETLFRQAAIDYEKAAALAPEGSQIAEQDLKNAGLEWTSYGQDMQQQSGGLHLAKAAYENAGNDFL